MAKRGSRSRRARSLTPPFASRRLPRHISDFDDAWLNDFRERGIGSIDLTDIEDRRRWHPSSTWPRSELPPRGIRQARIVVVPEGHRLARHQSYGGKYTPNQLRALLRRSSRFYGTTKTWTKARERGAHGVHDVIRTETLPHRIGFALPWQVIICVRRKRRREVFHAFKLAGRRGLGLSKKRRTNRWSEVRC